MRSRGGGGRILFGIKASWSNCTVQIRTGVYRKRGLERDESGMNAAIYGIIFVSKSIFLIIDAECEMGIIVEYSG